MKNVVISFAISLLFSIHHIFGQTLEHQILNGQSFTAVSYQTHDYDRDGDHDILALEFRHIGAKKSIHLVWLENDPLHRFHLKREINLGEIPLEANHLFVQDYNSDGATDILLHCEASQQKNGTILFFPGQSKNVFGPKVILNQFDFSKTERADFNNDGKIDILASGYIATPLVGTQYRRGRNQELRLFLSAKDSFYIKPIDTGIDNVGEFCSGDINNDGFIDIIYSTKKGLHFLINDKKGGFEKGSAVGLRNASTLYNLEILDINNDKRKEIVFLTESPDHGKLNYLDPLKGFQISEFQIKTNHSFYFNYGTYFKDVNKDKLMDIVANEAGDICFYVQQPGGIFTRRDITRINGDGRMELIDLDQDNDLDVLSFSTNFLNTNAFWFENINSSYACHLIYIEDKKISATQFLDIDQDGDQDIIVAECIQNGALILFKNDGQGNFTNYFFTHSTYAYRIQTLDVNQDGFLDPVMCTTKGELVWMKNSGKFELWPETVIDSNLFSPQSLLVQDLNNDKRKDIVVGCYGDSKLFYYRNAGLGKFVKYLIDSDISKPRKVLSADFNQDNHQDLVVLSEDSIALIRVYLNQKNTGFMKGYELKGAFGKDMCLFDVNNDQKMDIVYTAKTEKQTTYPYTDTKNRQLLALVKDSLSFKQEVLMEIKPTEKEIFLLNTFKFKDSPQLIYSSFNNHFRELVLTFTSYKNGIFSEVQEKQFEKVMHSFQGGFMEENTVLVKNFSELLFTTYYPFKIIYLRKKE